MPTTLLNRYPENLTAEAQLLIACARLRMDIPTRKRITELVKAGIGWERFTGLAERHRVVPLVYRCLKSTAGELLPEKVLRRYQTLCRQIAAGNLFLTVELRRLLSLLTAEDIPAVPLKGPLLAQTIFGNVALRTFNDLDILIKREDLERATALLQAQGYLSTRTLTSSGQKVHLRTHHAYGFLHRQRNVFIELQWGISKNYFSVKLDFEALQPHLQSLQFGGMEVQKIRDEFLLILLIVHGTKHAWQRLNWLCDVAELIHGNPALHWPTVITCARELRCMRMLGVGLLLTKTLLGVRLPEAITTLVQNDPQLPRLAEEIIQKLFDEEAETVDLFESTAFQLRVRERRRDRLRYFFHFVFDPTVWDVERLSSPALPAFCFYLVPPMRVLVGSHTLSRRQIVRLAKQAWDDHRAWSPIVAR